MQTFLPYPSFYESAKTLDVKRLNKQRVEGRDILYLCLRHKGFEFKNIYSEKQREFLWKRYRNHPAVRMWRGFEDSLADYVIEICKKWRNFGYKDQMLIHVLEMKPNLNSKKPSWLGLSIFHKKHRAALLYKNQSWYGKFKWSEEPLMDYYWPC